MRSKERTWCAIGAVGLLVAIAAPQRVQTQQPAARSAPDLATLFAPGGILQDRNGDDVIDFVNARIVLSQAPDAADVSAAAGPVGRSGSVDAGYKAGILTYSSSKGAFIGASLNGAELQQDHKATKAWYGDDVPFKDILSGKVKTPNEEARAFVNAVQNAKENAQSH